MALTDAHTAENFPGVLNGGRVAKNDAAVVDIPGQIIEFSIPLWGACEPATWTAKRGRGRNAHAPEGHAAASHMIALSLLKQHAVTSLVPPSFRQVLAPRFIPGFRYRTSICGRIRKGGGERLLLVGGTQKMELRQGQCRFDLGSRPFQAVPGRQQHQDEVKIEDSPRDPEPV